MNNRSIILLIAVMTAVTALLRFLPFIIFDHGKQLPAWITYLGKALPPAIMSMLLVYCLRNTRLTEIGRCWPELVCVGVAMLMHHWKRNTLLSIGASTFLYMVIIRCIL